eukprot:c15376_g1_i1.p3 GENE.c15376_g1_i1~~c15376_g1_i1.p3  ORF type:complete len:158 (-),score=33.30 c15376_g1_i1:45-518(-)
MHKEALIHSAQRIRALTGVKEAQLIERMERRTARLENALARRLAKRVAMVSVEIREYELALLLQRRLGPSVAGALGPRPASELRRQQAERDEDDGDISDDDKELRRRGRRGRTVNNNNGDGVEEGEGVQGNARAMRPIRQQPKDRARAMPHDDDKEA